jgi:hypothetical protein
MHLNLNNFTKLRAAITSILVIGFLFITPSKAQNKNYVDLQTYTIRSLDGIPQKISVMLDYDDRLKISYLKDTLCVYRSYGVEGKPLILGGKFLEIMYGYKEGSNIEKRRALFLCINRNKLYVPMEVTSLSTFDLGEVYNKEADSLKLFNEYARYELKLKLSGKNGASYKLAAKVYDMSVSKRDPPTNHYHVSNTTLNFDSTENIFYNDYKNIDETLTVYYPDTQTEKKQHIKGAFPVISLGKIEYYYINKGWFEKGSSENRGNYLTGYSQRLN